MILGLCGLARSGKDAAAAHLVDAHGYRRIAFADPMRAALLALDPLVDIGITIRLSRLVADRGWDAAKAYPDVRATLQRFGTEVGRKHFGDGFWVDLALRDVTAGERVVVTDVRFPNEAAAVRALGGYVVRLERPGAGLRGLVAGHPSEALAFPVDEVVANDGTLDDLHRVFDGLVHEPSPAVNA